MISFLFQCVLHIGNDVTNVVILDQSIHGNAMVYIFFMKSSFTCWRKGNNMLGFSLTTVACFRPSATSGYFFNSLLRKRSGLHMWSRNRWFINHPKIKHTNSIATLFYKCAKVIMISEEWKWKLFFPALITRYSCIFWATGSISIPAKKLALPPSLPFWPPISCNMTLGSI